MGISLVNCRICKHSIMKTCILAGVIFTKVSALMLGLFALSGCQSIDLKQRFGDFPVKRFDKIGLEISLPTSDVSYTCFKERLYVSMKEIPNAWFSFVERRCAAGVTVERVSNSEYTEKLNFARSRKNDPYNQWNSAEQHLSVSSFDYKNECRFFRYDVLCPNGDYLVVEATATINSMSPEEIETVGKIVGSVKPLR